jgi:hypothetical protein
MIMQGLMSGMQSEVGDVMKMLNGLNVSIPANFNSDLLANAGSLYVGAKDRTGQEMGGLRQEFHITTTDDGRIAARVIARETQDALEVM